MAIIQKEIRLVGSKGEGKVIAIFDSGASYSCIQPELAKELGMVERLPEPMDFGTAKKGESLSANEAVRLNFHLNGYRFSDEFMLIPNLSQPVIIGAKTLQAWRMKLNFETDEVIIDPRVTKLRLLVGKLETGYAD
ncbi:MAG: retropepsin-like domain-containing protein [Dehalococcoidia bacterium]|nr:retropepsin-like domain-containing protein [Dehalococcoidia bacterium]MDH5781876.1 retropepsin-like domain-containing protein [Dehalococcoidia bacterium]